MTSNMHTMQSMADVSIVGAAGYTGQETLDRVLGHPQLRARRGRLGLARGPGRRARSTRGSQGRPMPAFVTNEEALAHEADVTIVCLSHEAAAAIDVPADGCRRRSLGRAPAARRRRLRGVVRLRAPASRAARRLGLRAAGARRRDGPAVANPGCYATATLLALAPIRDAIDPGSVVVDGLSGMTGAGRTPKDSSHAGAVLENVSPYRVGTHQHVPEIAQLLGFPVSFTPHLLPVRRGLIATCNVRSTGPDLRALLEDAYAGSAVVTVLPEGMAPELARVQHTDRAEIGVFADRFTDRTIVICAEDNLGKGAAGQAIQNVNRALGLDDTLGLRLGGVMV